MDIIKQFAVTDPLSAAADAFARNLASYETDHIRGVMSSKAALKAEVLWWHDNETQQSGVDGDDVFVHADLDAEEIAKTVVSLYKNWKWRDASEYGVAEMVIPDDLDEDEAKAIAETPRDQRPRKLRKGELAVATILERY